MRFQNVILLFFLVITFQVSAQAERPWWYTLEQGKQYLRSGAYGDALIAFENARRARIDQFTRMEQELIRLFSTPDVRRLGDSMDLIEQYIVSHHETDAAAALSELYYRVPKDSLKGSAQKVLEAIDHLKNYPDAEYWLGESYRSEGELGLALTQYERALDNQDLLETPGFDTEILYKIVEVHRLRREYQEMEKRANEIIGGKDSSGTLRDTLWAGNQIRSAMARVMENEGVDHFLTLYRYNDTVTEKAHRLLGFFYYASSRYSLAAEHLMFAFLIQNTVILDDIIRGEFDFTYTNLQDLADKIRSKPDLSEYVDQTEYYRTIYYLASSLYATGKTKPASQLWAFLAGNNNAGEWGERARRYPNPFVDRAIEMP